MYDIELIKKDLKEIREKYNILIDCEAIDQYDNGQNIQVLKGIIPRYTYTGYVFMNGDFNLDFSESYDSKLEVLYETINKVKKYLEINVDLLNMV